MADAKRTMDKPIEASDISEYLRTQDDFAFELRTLKACTEMGLDVMHGGTYQDLSTGKFRQFDIRAGVRMDFCCLQLSIECKNLRPASPLVVSCVPRKARECFNEILFSGVEPLIRLDGGREIIPNGITARVVPMVGPDSIYAQKAMVGKCMAQISRGDRDKLKGGDSEVFDRWSQALASSHDVIEFAGSFASDQKVKWFLTSVIPILVVPDETLWVVNYADDGSREGEPEQTGECIIYVGKEYDIKRGDSRPYSYQYHISHLHIMTLRALYGFLDALKKRTGYWDGIFKMDIIQKRLQLQLR